MNCNESLTFLDASLDGELDLVRQLELEEHLKQCPACAAAAETGRLAREVMRTGLPRYKASDALTQRIQASLPRPLPARIKATLPSEKEKPSSRGVWAALAAATSLAAAFFFGLFTGGAREHAKEIASEAVAAHVRSLMGNHLTDIASTDQHNVKPWFAGKVDFAPPVLDLSTQEFPLVGGRLEQIDHHAAVALVYRRRQHTINLLIWPKNGERSLENSFQITGYHLIGWTRDDLNFLAISDVAMSDLELFANAYRSSR